MNSYVTLNQIKDPGNLNINENTFDTMLMTWAESVSRFIDDFTHRSFYCYEGEKIFNGAGSTLNLPLDLLSVSSLKLDESGDGTYSITAASTDYILNPTYTYPKTYIKLSYNSNLSSFASTIPAGVKINGVWGYGTGETATPYYDSGVTASVAVTGTTLTLSAEGTIQVGHTIRVNSEQMYVTGVSSDGSKTATVIRAVNGTTAALHPYIAAYDLNSDGVLDITDVNLLISVYGTVDPNNPLSVAADLNKDGKVNVQDFGLLANEIAGAQVYIYQYPPTIVSCTLVQLGIWWNRRKNSYSSVEGNPEMGTMTMYRGLDPMIKELLEAGKLKRHTI